MSFADTITHDVPLAPRTTLGVGGPARTFGIARTEADIVEANLWAASRGLRLVPLGAGSNVVVGDEGLDALVLVIALRGIHTETLGARVRMTCGAGEPWGEVVERAVGSGWAGLECLAGIPGLVGATPIQNVGAYGQQVSDSIVSVRALERATQRVHDLEPASCAFGYRDSVFRSAERDRWIVLGVTFELVIGGAPLVAYAELERHLAARASTQPSLVTVRDAVIELRRRKGMVLDPSDPDTRSVGSFFVNPIVETTVADDIETRARATGVLGPHEQLPRYAEQAPDRVKVPAGWLIERAGLTRGTALARAAISSKHALAIVNRGGASTREVLALARHIRDVVRDRFGVSLTPEPILLGCGLDP